VSVRETAIDGIRRSANDENPSRKIAEAARLKAVRPQGGV
jgi:hypothetical protein